MDQRKGYSAFSSASPLMTTKKAMKRIKTKTRMLFVALLCLAVSLVNSQYRCDECDGRTCGRYRGTDSGWYTSDCVDDCDDKKWSCYGSCNDKCQGRGFDCIKPCNGDCNDNEDDCSEDCRDDEDRRDEYCRDQALKPTTSPTGPPTSQPSARVGSGGTDRSSIDQTTEDVPSASSGQAVLGSAIAGLLGLWITRVLS